MPSHEHYEQKSRVNTPRLFLRPMVLSDAELIVSWRNSLESRSMFFNSEELSLEKHLKWFNGRRCNRVDYVFCENSKGQAIGTVNFKNIDELAGSAEAGKLLGEISFRKKGLAKEAFAAWLIFGFDVLELNEIFVVTRADNHININLNLNLGFKEIKESANISLQNRKFIKMVLYSNDTDLLYELLSHTS